MDRAELIEQAIATGCNMAQELQDFADAAKECGDSLPGVVALIDEWNEIWRRLEGIQ